jgi:hypothetical protein
LGPHLGVVDFGGRDRRGLKLTEVVDSLGS